MSTDQETSQRFSLTWQRLAGFVLLGIIPLLTGVGLAQLVAPRPAVGIIRLNSDIWSGSAFILTEQIEEARRDPRIRAVVLQLNSPGGEVVATQSLYLEVQRLRRQMPVVGSIDDVAASGAFYLALATDPVYAKPSSVVGNVGVWGFAPPDVGVNDVILASGPFKLVASNQEEFTREIEGIKQEFIATVVDQRGERLHISPADLAQGLAYPGRESMRLGLIDHLGSQTDAIHAAAERAGIFNYDVVDLEARVIARLLASGQLTQAAWPGAADPLTGHRVLPPGIYLLYDVRLGGAP